MRKRLPALLLALTVMTLCAGVAAAQARYDTPTLSLVDKGYFRLTLAVTAGPSGTPAGFSVQWMKYSDFEALGLVWPDETHPSLKRCVCVAPYVLNDWAGSPIMGSGETSYLQLGDLADESYTSIYGNDYAQLTPGTRFVIRVYAEGDGYTDPSDFSSVLDTRTMVLSECTQGFWKNHGPAGCNSGSNANVWPASCFPMMLGNVAYTEAQICSILNQPVNGNGLVSLAHQLITTLLNGCNGSDLSSVSGTIADANALIGNLVIPPVGGGSLPPASTSDLTETLDDYNNGIIAGVVNCPTAVHSNTTWGRIKVLYR